jgi:hypothetical protein
MYRARSGGGRTGAILDARYDYRDSIRTVLVREEGQAGARVTLLEGAGRVGADTSGRSFAWTNSNGNTPRTFHNLNVAGMQAHAALGGEFGSAPWWHGGGSARA